MQQELHALVKLEDHTASPGNDNVDADIHLQSGRCPLTFANMSGATRSSPQGYNSSAKAGHFWTERGQQHPNDPAALQICHFGDHARCIPSRKQLDSNRDVHPLSIPSEAYLHQSKTVCGKEAGRTKVAARGTTDALQLQLTGVSLLTFWASQLIMAALAMDINSEDASNRSISKSALASVNPVRLAFLKFTQVQLRYMLVWGTHLQHDMLLSLILYPDIVNLDGRVSKGEMLEIDVLYEACWLILIHQRLD